jgi:hypothetical protein
MGAPQLRYGGANREVSAPARRPIAFNPYRHTDHPALNRVLRSYLPIYGASLAYAYPGYIGPGFLDYPDSGPYNDSTYVAPQQPASVPAAEYDAPPVEQADATPAAAYRPAYVRPQPTPEPPAEPAVTLIFKDGRPPEQIQNYMLTRTTVYVQETRLREIPVDQLDLAATEKVNLDTGTDFQLPHAGK